jgi:hypothetical protein
VGSQMQTARTVIVRAVWRKIAPGGVLLSHLVSKAVPSALESLTAVFEMGTGVASPLSPPENFWCRRRHKKQMQTVREHI